MIRSLSPHYIETPFVNPANGITCDAYILEVFVWSGEKLSPPSEPEYRYTIPNPTGSTGTNKVNIARVIDDYVDFTPQTATTTGLVDAENAVWVKTQVRFGNDGVFTVVGQFQTTELMVRGYYYGMDNQALGDPVIRLSGTDFKVKSGGLFCVPILGSETSDTEITVKSYPELSVNSIDLSFDIPATTHSSKLIQNLWILIPDLPQGHYINISQAGSEINSVVLLLTDEWKYTPVQILFQNKFGAEQVMTFFKERSSNLNVTSESFESDRGQPIDGKHQFVTYNVQGREGFKMNSGFVSEDRNETFKQLFLSERQWILEGELLTPINIKTSALTYKTQLKEKLINYEVEFEYSYNEINNI